MSLLDFLHGLVSIGLASVAIAGSILVLYLIFYVLRYLIVWAGAYFVILALVVMMLLIVYGYVGEDLGLSNLFIPQISSSAVTPDRSSAQTGWLDALKNRLGERYTQLASALALSVLLLMLSLIVHLLDRGRFLHSEYGVVARLERKRKQLINPFLAPWEDVWSIFQAFRRIFYDEVPRPAVLSVPAPEAIRQTVRILLWGPCLFLAVLFALPAFRNVRGTQNIFWEIEWYWLGGLGLGFVLSWLMIRFLTVNSVADLFPSWIIPSALRTWWQETPEQAHRPESHAAFSSNHGVVARTPEQAVRAGHHGDVSHRRSTSQEFSVPGSDYRDGARRGGRAGLLLGAIHFLDADDHSVHALGCSQRLSQRG